VLDAPTGIMADTAVVAAIREGEYGKYRKWGAVGWGTMSFISGAFIDRFGMRAGFISSLIFMIPTLACGWGLHGPMQQRLQARSSALERMQAAAARKVKARAELAKRLLSPVQVGADRVLVMAAPCAVAALQRPCLWHLKPRLQLPHAADLDPMGMLLAP
jgi:hypothetical protein